jgi:hypothetical protein
MIKKGNKIQNFEFKSDIDLFIDNVRSYSFNCAHFHFVYSSCFGNYPHLLFFL